MEVKIHICKLWILICWTTVEHSISGVPKCLRPCRFPNFERIQIVTRKIQIFGPFKDLSEVPLHIVHILFRTVSWVGKISQNSQPEKERQLLNWKYEPCLIFARWRNYRLIQISQDPDNIIEMDLGCHQNRVMQSLYLLRVALHGHQNICEISKSRAENCEDASAVDR